MRRTPIAAAVALMLTLQGCAGFTLGSIVYCAKDDACDVTITKPKAAPAAPAPAAAAPAAK